MNYFWSGAIALLLGWALTGCIGDIRLGNHVERGPNADEVTGYYETEAQSVTFCAELSELDCVPGKVSSIPKATTERLTNPLALKLLDYKTREAALYNPDVASPAYYPVFAENEGKIHQSGSYQKHILWLDEQDCTSQESLVVDGTIHKNQGPYHSGTTHPLSGRLELKVQLIRNFSGECTSALTKAIQCRNDAGKCRQEPADFPAGYDPALYVPNQDMQRFYADLFAPYIDAGLITEAQIPSLKTIAYEVRYK